MKFIQPHIICGLHYRYTNHQFLHGPRTQLWENKLQITVSEGVYTCMYISMHVIIHMYTYMYKCILFNLCTQIEINFVRKLLNRIYITQLHVYTYIAMYVSVYISLYAQDEHDAYTQQ